MKNRHLRSRERLCKKAKRLLRMSKKHPRESPVLLEMILHRPVPARFYLSLSTSMPMVVGGKAVQSRAEEQGHNLRLKDEAPAFQLRLELVRHMHRIKLKRLMTVNSLQGRTLEAKVETVAKQNLGASDMARTLLLMAPKACDNLFMYSRLSRVGLGVVASIEDVAMLVA